MAKYKNIGGIFRTKDGKIIKHNEVFEAKPSDIPKAFKDVIVQIKPQRIERTVHEDESEENVETAKTESSKKGK